MNYAILHVQAILASPPAVSNREQRQCFAEQRCHHQNNGGYLAAAGYLACLRQLS